MIRQCQPDDTGRIYLIIYEAAGAYAGIIPLTLQYPYLNQAPSCDLCLVYAGCEVTKSTDALILGYYRQNIRVLEPQKGSFFTP